MTKILLYSLLLVFGLISSLAPFHFVIFQEMEKAPAGEQIK